MSHNILITGASGYLGGTLLARWKDAHLPAYSKLYALVRTKDQAEAVQQYGAESITMKLDEPSSIEQQIVDNRITIVYYLIDAWGRTATPFINALAKVKQTTGQDVHFLFVSGAKMFSDHAGASTDKPLLDTDPNLYSSHKNQKPKHGLLDVARRANITVIDTADSLGVKSYIFVPCIVYGRGEGFGNQISIQTVAIVKAAKKVKGVYKVDEGRPSWPICHVLDNTTLFLDILRRILEGEDVGYGKNGFFLASPGSVAWDDLYAAIGKGLKTRGLVDDEEVREADESILSRMGEALGCGKELVGVQLGGW